jgi:hypothetical protein
VGITETPSRRSRGRGTDECVRPYTTMVGVLYTSSQFHLPNQELLLCAALSLCLSS